MESLNIMETINGMKHNMEGLSDALGRMNPFCVIDSKLAPCRGKGTTIQQLVHLKHNHTKWKCHIKSDLITEHGNGNKRALSQDR